jgi:hypothetical protein
LLPQLGVDRIMFLAGHPYASMAYARAFLDQLVPDDLADLSGSFFVDLL